MTFTVWLDVSYDTKTLYIHAKRVWKKRQGPTIKPEYRLELKDVNARELGGVIQKEFGELFQGARIKTTIVDNGRKAHCTILRDEWATFAIDVWPGAGAVGDRSLISEFTGEDADKLGGFLINSSDCMVLDQLSVNNTWTNLAGGLNDMFQKRKPSRKTKPGFINDINSSFENLCQGRFREQMMFNRK